MKKTRTKSGARRPRVKVDLEELDGILDAAVDQPISKEDSGKVKTTLHALVERLTPKFRSSEKTSDVLPSGTAPESKKKRPPGHGRNGADALVGAMKVRIAHEELTPGCVCPGCQNGKVYLQKKPKSLVRFVGQAPFYATVYELDKMRCNLCGEVFTAPAPEGVGTEVYDETVPSMLAWLKYGNAFPMHRIKVIQERLGIPLPTSTQWDIVHEAAELLKPVHQHLIVQAAQGDVVHNDDSKMRVLELARAASDPRTGVFTSGIVSVFQDHKIGLFFTGPQHAGENLADVLRHRAAGLGPVVQMSDALSWNVADNRKPAAVARGNGDSEDPVKRLLANCLAHGRRKIVDQVDNFPGVCGVILNTIGEVYGYDADARDKGLSPSERLTFHQRLSGPLMEDLENWMTSQLAEKRVEPNSGLGEALTYFLKHWEALTLFLRVEGAPLDNNLVERALKKAVLHRKNALFYRTLNGSQVGDLYMSLIHTCDLNDANPFDYLTELQRHAAEIRDNPSAWMPWNYRETLARAVRDEGQLDRSPPPATEDVDALEGGT